MREHIHKCEFMIKTSGCFHGMHGEYGGVPLRCPHGDHLPPPISLHQEFRVLMTPPSLGTVSADQTELPPLPGPHPLTPHSHFQWPADVGGQRPGNPTGPDFPTGQLCYSSTPPLPGSRPSSYPPDTLPQALVPKGSLLTPAHTPRSLPQGTRPGQLPQDTFPDKALPPPLAILISSPSHLRAGSILEKMGAQLDAGLSSLWLGEPPGRALGKDP